MKTKIRVDRPTVYVEGGVLQGMEGFKPGQRIDVIDYDNDGVPDAELCKCNAGDGKHFHGRLIANEKGQA